MLHPCWNFNFGTLQKCLLHPFFFGKAWSFLKCQNLLPTRFPIYPPEIWAEILPDKNFSVIDFLKFHLPVPTRSPITNLHEYLSHLSPTITNINEMKSIPTPPATVLNELIQSPDAALSQSVLCLHAVGLSGEWLPMWILDYWNQVTYNLSRLNRELLETICRSRGAINLFRIRSHWLSKSTTCYPAFHGWSISRAFGLQ